jgi:hypothetical protein
MEASLSDDDHVSGLGVDLDIPKGVILTEVGCPPSQFPTSVVESEDEGTKVAVGCVSLVANSKVPSSRLVARHCNENGIFGEWRKDLPDDLGEVCIG